MNPRLMLAAAAPLIATFSVGARADSSRGFVLVANKGNETLSIVDASTETQVATVQEGARTAHEIAVSPDGRFAYLPIYGDSGVGQKGTDGQLMRVVDLRKREIVGTLDFGKGIRPHRPLFGPKDGLLYVTTELLQSVSIIDPATLKVVGSVPTGEDQSHMLVISNDGRRGYTANVHSGTVSVLDLVGRTLVTTIPVATRVQRICISTDDRWVFTADQTKLRLVAIDTSKNAVAASIPLPGLAFGASVTPDGKGLLATIPALRMVAYVDLAKMRVVRTIDVPKAPQEILVRPDGAVAYVSCDASAKLAVIDLKAWKVEKLVDVGPVDDGLAWAPAL